MVRRRVSNHQALLAIPPDCHEETPIAMKNESSFLNLLLVAGVLALLSWYTKHKTQSELPKLDPAWSKMSGYSEMLKPIDPNAFLKSPTSLSDLLKNQNGGSGQIDWPKLLGTQPQQPLTFSDLLKNQPPGSGQIDWSKLLAPQKPLSFSELLKDTNAGSPQSQGQPQPPPKTDSPPPPSSIPAPNAGKQQPQGG
jgi:hypothetical protein